MGCSRYKSFLELLKTATCFICLHMLIQSQKCKFPNISRLNFWFTGFFVLLAMICIGIWGWNGKITEKLTLSHKYWCGKQVECAKMSAWWFPTTFIQGTFPRNGSLLVKNQFLCRKNDRTPRKNEFCGKKVWVFVKIQSGMI